MAAPQAFADGVWLVDGPSVRDFGFMFTTRMTVVRLGDGSLWLSSPVVVPFDTLGSIAQLGSVRYLVAATQRHVWRLEGWHTLFPNAQLWAAPKTLFTLSKGGLPSTGVLGDTPAAAWADDLDQLLFKGSRLIKEILFLHRRSGTLILEDLVQVHEPAPGQPVRNALIAVEGVRSPYGGVGLDIRLSFTNRRLARQSLERLLSWDFDKLIIAHGPCIKKDARQFVERAFRWLVH
jgi:hypothetical protein